MTDLDLYRRRPRFVARALLLLGVLVGAVLMTTGCASAPPPEAVTNTLPLSETRPGEQPKPIPPAAEGELFFQRSDKTASASVRVDADGGIHAAYVYFTPFEENPPAVYRYCPGPSGACENPANWSDEVQLGEGVDEVQLQLTPRGEPRLLLRAGRTESEGLGGKDFIYAECDADCTTARGWRTGFVTYKWGTEINDVSDNDRPQRYFALDHQGRPRFVYYDRNYFYSEPDHFGVYYAQCDANCTESGNWALSQVGRRAPYDAEIFSQPSLQFTSTGQPRIASHVFALNEDGTSGQEGLYYLGCDAECDERENWQRLLLLYPGSGSYPHPGWDLELDADDRPRIAVFMGGGTDSSALEYRLHYLWCDADCFSSNENWYFDSLDLEANEGVSPDLELDARGHPHVAWHRSSGDAGNSSCDEACESEDGQWQHQVVDTSEELQEEFPQAVPGHCESPTWYGLAPVLALDAAGHPHIAYDTPVEAYCLYVPVDRPDDPYNRFEYIWRSARLVFFP